MNLDLSDFKIEKKKRKHEESGFISCTTTLLIQYLSKSAKEESSKLKFLVDILY